MPCLIATKRCTFVTEFSFGMVERIRELLQVNQLTPTQFADSIGVARPIISHILSGRNKPSLEVAQKILTAFPLLSPGWLLKGTGDMLEKAPSAAASGASPTASPVPEDTAGPPLVRKAAKVPRYRPQTVPAVPEAARQATHAPEEPSALVAALAPQPAPVAPAPVASVEALAATQSAPAAVTVSAVAGPAAAAPAALPAQSADVSLARAFAEPGKSIRRIVIFYQDGTFTDYQPEPSVA